MCYSKDDGGIRCEYRRGLNRNEKRLKEATARLEVIKEAMEQIKAGNPQVVVNGVLRRKQGLKREGEELSTKVSVLKVEGEELRKHWNLSSKGISELRDKAEDASLPIEQRKHYEALADASEKERGRILDALDKKRLGERNLEAVMKADGFDKATIDECNIEISTNKYPRTSKEYKRRIAKAVNEMQALEAERMDALRACKPADRGAVEAEYASKLAVVNVERLDAQYGYESTIEGLKDLKAQATDRSVKMKMHERRTLERRYERAKKRHEGDKRDRNNRDNRRNAIKRAYRAKGLDATNALNAHTLTIRDEKKVVGNLAPALKSNIRRTVMLTASETAQVEADFKASGYKHYSAYIRDKAMGVPTQHFQNKSLRKLNQEAEQFSNGEAHRQWTTRVGKRDVSNDIKVNIQDNEKISARANAFHMTRSSYMRCMVLGIDPRQIQNDRSEITNTIKTAMMEEMERKSA